MKDNMFISEITKDEYSMIKNKLGIMTPEDIEKSFEKYNWGFLDVFDHCLSFEEADKFLSSFVNHNLKYEDRFVKFFNLVYEVNENNPVYMYFDLKGLEESEILNILDTLDYEDKLMFIKQIINLKSKGDYYKVEDKKVLKLFIKLATRELYFPIFYFTYVPMIISGNFDLSFPIFCRSAKDFMLYKEIAKRVDLYIRDK